MKEETKKFFTRKDCVLFRTMDIYLLLSTAMKYLYDNGMSDHDIDMMLNSIFTKNRVSETWVEEFFKFIELVTNEVDFKGGEA